MLDRHCQDVGRDPREVTRTRLGTLVIAPTAAAAQAKTERYGLAEGVAGGFVTAGGPDEVAAEVRDLLDAGLDGLMFNMPDAHDLDTVRLAGETLTQRIGAA